jgi:hypothetical protein
VESGTASRHVKRRQVLIRLIGTASPSGRQRSPATLESYIPKKTEFFVDGYRARCRLSLFLCSRVSGIVIESAQLTFIITQPHPQHLGVNKEEWQEG